MHQLVSGVLSMTHSNMQIFLEVWRVQLDSLQRCGSISAQAAVAWHERALAPWKALPPAGDAPKPASQCADPDSHIGNLLVCWRDMYHAVTMHEAIGEIQPQLTRLVQERIDEFNCSLAVARAGESTHAAPSRSLEIAEGEQDAAGTRRALVDVAMRKEVPL